MKTFLEVEGKMGPIPTPGSQFRPPLPDTNACALVKAALQIQDHFMQFLPTYTTRIFFKIGGYEVNYFWNHIMGSFSNFN